MFWSIKYKIQLVRTVWSSIRCWHTCFIGVLLSISCSADNVFALVVSGSFTSVKKLLTTELSQVSENVLQNMTVPFASKAEPFRLTEKQISGSGGALNILTAMVEIILELICLFQNNIRKFSGWWDGGPWKTITILGDLCLTLKKITETANVFSQLQSAVRI